MQAGRKESVAALVVAAAALLLTCVFGILTFTPGVDPGIGSFLQLSFFASAIMTMGAGVAYFVLSRRSRGGEASRFDRLVEQRAAALGAVPVGLVAVLIGVLWYVTKSAGDQGALGEVPGSQAFAAIDTVGIAAFLGFGSIYLLTATYLAIRAERSAIRIARQDAGVSP